MIKANTIKNLFLLRVPCNCDICHHKFRTDCNAIFHPSKRCKCCGQKHLDITFKKTYNRFKSYWNGL